MKTAQELYEQFIADTGMDGRALKWDDLPQLVRTAWENVRKACQDTKSPD